MTDEAQGHSPEEAPTPPASTRWSEEPVADDDALAPPFVPGRPATSASHAADEETTPSDEEAVPVEELLGRQDTLPGEDPHTATDEDEDAFPFETDAMESPELGSGSEEDDFPFEQFDIEGGEAGQPEVTAAGAESDDDMGWSPAALYGDEADEAPGVEEPGEAEADHSAAGGEGEPAALAEAGPDGFPGEEEEADPWATAPEAPEQEWQEEKEAQAEQEDPWQSEPEAPWQPEPEDPWQPEQPEGVESAEGVGSAEWLESAEGVEPVESAALSGGAEQEVAGLLEDMAQMLREEGASAVRREMDSDDRLTALLAGLVAGYLSGRS